MSISPLGENLIFIISQPRAGSTLLQRVIASHPEVGTLAEPWFMLHPIYGLRRDGIETEYKFLRWRNALDDFLSHLPEGEEAYIRATREMASVLYNEACAALGKPRFLDKTPPYYFIIPDLYRVFPEASFIILLRNPLAVLSSILHTWVKGDWMALATHYHHLMVAPQKLLEGIQLLGKDALVVQYERYVDNPESETQRICQHIGINFDPGMLVYGNTPTLSGRMGDPTGVDQHDRPIKASLDRWVELGSVKQTRIFALEYLKALGPDTISKMGYDYNSLESTIGSVKCSQTGPTVSWQRVFEPQRTFWQKAQLLIVELIQRRSWKHSFNQFARLFLGRL